MACYLLKDLRVARGDVLREQWEFLLSQGKHYAKREKSLFILMFLCAECFFFVPSVLDSKK